MAGYLVSDTRKVTSCRLKEMKQKGEKIAMLTSYDFTMAGIVDGAGVDAILVGDSASNVMAGNATTLPITVDEMIVYARSVVRAVKRAFVVCDMPFGSYQVTADDGVRNAVRIMKETGCDGVKIEGGAVGAGLDLLQLTDGCDHHGGVGDGVAYGLAAQSVGLLDRPCGLLCVESAFGDDPGVAGFAEADRGVVKLKIRGEKRL